MIELKKVITGKRKTSIARIRLYPGEGKVIINKREGLAYFGRPTVFHHAIEPLKITETLEKYNIKANIRGGGLTGQAAALRLAIAKSLCGVEPDLRGKIKKAGMLTRDSRIVERKKAGLHKARKATQFSKR